MSFLETNFKNIVLSHMLEFEALYNKAKILLTTDTFEDVKYRLLLLLFDYYNIISFFEKDENIKKEKFDSIKQFENNVINLLVRSESLDIMKDIYNKVIMRISEYLFKEES